MQLSHFFISRPIFASMLSLVFVITGLIAMTQLPLSEYPAVVPPTVSIKASYPGANPKVISQTVATPIEQELNGLENMLYYSSLATSDGGLSITVTFALGTDLDMAQIQVQNRVSNALPRLPEDVQRLGVTAEKASPNLALGIQLYSPDGSQDVAYLANYADQFIIDELKKLPGVGDTMLNGGARYAMRVWLDPDAMANKGLTAIDVVSALRTQNQQVAAGALGAQPAHDTMDFQILLNVKGRLESVEEFEKIVLQVGEQGQLTYLADVARIELGSENYALRANLDGKPAVGMPVFQRPGSNAIQLSDDVRATLARLSEDFPPGIAYNIAYDPTLFVRGSINAVTDTLFEAIALVVIVVILFLQTWRASIIPLIAVPVSLLGTFAVMYILGLSINTLTLFGMVLAIGIVVDDAIVVVENVERNINAGHNPIDATKLAMNEVSGPIIAIAVVLCAVFIPTIFISGLSGQFYKQFAVTITISTIISTFNSLTLSPALSALLLKKHNEPEDKLSRLLSFLFKKHLFAPFNRLFDNVSQKYDKIVKTLVRKGTLVFGIYLLLLVATGGLFNTVPGGFIPQQDKQYLVAIAQLPDAASLDRTEAVAVKMQEIALEIPGVLNTVAFPGRSINGPSNSPNAAIVFVPLEDFDKRNSEDMTANAIATTLNAKYDVIDEAFVRVFPPPPILGLGSTGGFKLQLQDRDNQGFEVLFDALQIVIKEGSKHPALLGLFSSFRIQTPQLNINIDREQALIQGIRLEDIYTTLQVYLGSAYINDFNLFGRTYQVSAQADSQFRTSVEQILRLQVQNSRGEMVPLGSVITAEPTTGPDKVQRYNGYMSAELNGSPATGYSSEQAREAIQQVLSENLTNGVTYEWTEVTFQQLIAGNTMIYVFPLIIVFVFMVLASQYESLRLPFAIILIVPMTIFSALLGVYMLGGDNNIFTQIALVVLVALASKNAILMVEFARDKHQEGLPHIEAIVTACRLRLRPILMTSIAFSAGAIPLVIAQGAGAEMRHAMGYAVFFGMIGVTIFGLIFTPVFYVLSTRKYKATKEQNQSEPTMIEH